MVPQCPRQTARPEGFPRASGDGPMQAEDASQTWMFPPRERGWSVKRLQRLQGGVVSPARAGMVPCQSVRRWIRRRFPRASGDGPVGLLVLVPNAVFPPRERGWSLQHAPRRGQLPVSPARAGMVPDDPEEALQGYCFPRASGDGPAPDTDPAAMP